MRWRPSKRLVFWTVLIGAVLLMKYFKLYPFNDWHDFTGPKPIQLTVEPDYTLRRTATAPKQFPALAWIIEQDGLNVFNREAEGEVAYKWNGYKPGHKYAAYLLAFENNAYNPVSNRVEFVINWEDQPAAPGGVKPQAGQEGRLAYTISVNSQFVVSHARARAAAPPELTWVVLENGAQVLQKPASEDSVIYPFHKKGAEYTVYLTAKTQGGTYRVSNVLTYKP